MKTTTKRPKPVTTAATTEATTSTPTPTTTTSTPIDYCSTSTEVCKNHCDSFGYNGGNCSSNNACSCIPFESKEACDTFCRPKGANGTFCTAGTCICNFCDSQICSENCLGVKSSVDLNFDYEADSVFNGYECGGLNQTCICTQSDRTLDYAELKCESDYCNSYSQLKGLTKTCEAGKNCLLTIAMKNVNL